MKLQIGKWFYARSCRLQLRKRRRYPARVTKLLQDALQDYLKNPESWKVGGARNGKKLMLMQRTDLTNRQVRQYFANHQRETMDADSMEMVDNHEEEEEEEEDDLSSSGGDPCV
jgi:hypothetical protein